MAGILGKRLKWWDGSSWRPNPNMPNILVVPAANQATVTAITSIPASVNNGDAFTISGTVKTTNGVSVTNGSVQIQRSNNGGASWSNTGSSYSVTAGTFSVGSLTETGGYWYKAVYTPGTGNNASESGASYITCWTLTTFVKTYAATASRSYTGGGSPRTNTTHLYQGYGGSTYGVERSLILFPTQVGTDLASAYDITGLEVYMGCYWWSKNDGGTAVFRTHSNYSGVPGTWGGVLNLSGTVSVGWTTKSGAKWCDISPLKGVPSDWSSTKRGIALYVDSTDPEYYGYFAAYGESPAPILRVTYRQWVAQ